MDQPRSLAGYVRGVRALRSVEQFAALAGLSPGTIYKIESGQRRAPDLTTLTGLVAAGASMDALLAVLARKPARRRRAA